MRTRRLPCFCEKRKGSQKASASNIPEQTRTHEQVYLAAAQVLPHLLEEVRSEQLQQLVLPLVIHMLGKQDKQVMSSFTPLGSYMLTYLYL